LAIRRSWNLSAQYLRYFARAGLSKLKWQTEAAGAKVAFVETSFMRGIE
jgi:hypothetical protein